MPAPAPVGSRMGPFSWRLVLPSSSLLLRKVARTVTGSSTCLSNTGHTTRPIGLVAAEQIWSRNSVGG